MAVSDRVAVLRTHINENLILRSNPSEADVLAFVAENNRRYQAGEPGGPSGIPALLVKSAFFYDSEFEDVDDDSHGTEISLPSL